MAERCGTRGIGMVLPRVVSWLTPEQGERSIREVLRAPDRACSRQPATTFAGLWDRAEGLHSDNRVEEAVLRFMAPLCAYRAGLSAQARDGFAGYLEWFPRRRRDDPLCLLNCAAKWSLALALRRLGESHQGLELARSAAQEARESHWVWLEGAARLAMGRLLRELPQEQARAQAAFAEAYRLLSAAQPPDHLGVAYVRAHQARLALDEGEAFAALSLIREARSGFGRSRHYRALGNSRVFQGWAHLQLLATEAAGECGEDALARLHALGEGRGVVRALRLLGHVAFEEGRHEEAIGRFRELGERARDIGDELLGAEAQVGVAKSRAARGDLRGVRAALRKGEPVTRTTPITAAGVEWHAVDLVRRIRTGPLSSVPGQLRKLRALLRERNERRLKAECLALCGFELARRGQLRQAAPLLQDALEQASHFDAVGWTERFLATVTDVDVRQWITSLLTEIHERRDVAEKYSSLVVCSYAGLHDAKNLASRAYTDLELLQTEAPPEYADSPRERERQLEVNRLVPLLDRDFPRTRETLESASQKAFKAGRLAAEVAQQVLDGRTEIHLAPESVEVERLLADARDGVVQTAGLGECVVQVEPDVPNVWADKVYLGRVFDNLVGNAEKYARGSDIRLSASARAVGSREEVVIGFADTGPGIHPEDAEIIFEPFKDPSNYRDQSAEHGSGFGLFYCRKVVEAHGGEIWLESRVGEGATFYFTLPTPRQTRGAPGR